MLLLCVLTLWIASVCVTYHIYRRSECSYLKVQMPNASGEKLLQGVLLWPFCISNMSGQKKSESFEVPLCQFKTSVTSAALGDVSCLFISLFQGTVCTDTKS